MTDVKHKQTKEEQLRALREANVARSQRDYQEKLKQARKANNVPKMKPRKGGRRGG